MLGVVGDAADAHRARQLWLSRLGDIILAHLAGAPAGHIKKPVIHGEVDVRHKRRTAPNPCRSGGSFSLGAGSAGIVAVFST